MIILHKCKCLSVLNKSSVICYNSRQMDEMPHHRICRSLWMFSFLGHLALVFPFPVEYPSLIMTLKHIFLKMYIIFKKILEEHESICKIRISTKCLLKNSTSKVEVISHHKVHLHFEHFYLSLYLSLF